MKKLFSLVLVMALLASLFGCAQSSKTTQDADEAEQTSQQAEAPDTEEAPEAEEAPDTEEAPEAEEAPETEEAPGEDGAAEESSGPAGDGVVKIGALFPLSGANANQGQQDIDGVAAAVDFINSNGGIKSLGGAKVEVAYEDITSDSAQAMNVVERVLSAGEVLGCMGMSTSGLTLPSLAVFEKYMVPVVTGCTTNELTESGYKYVFETTVKNKYQGTVQVEFFQWLVEKGYTSGSTIAIVYENQPAGISTEESILAAIEGTELSVVYDESYPQGITDASSIAMKLKQANADVVFFYGSITEQMLIYNAMKGIGCNSLFIGGSGTAWPSFAESLEDHAEGICSVVNTSYDLKDAMKDEDWLAVIDNFESKYGYFMTEHVTNNYMATLVLCEAIEKAGEAAGGDISKVDGQAVREALTTLKYEHPNAAGGVIEFDENGYNNNARAVVVQWQNGTCRTVYPEDLASVDYIPPEG